MRTSASSRPPRRRPGRVPSLRGNRCERRRSYAGRPGARHRGGRPALLARGESAVAGPAAGRHLYPAGKHHLLFPARHLSSPLRGALAALLVARTPLRRVLLGLAALAALTGPVAAPAAAEETIRVAIVEGARAAELRGTDIEVVDVATGATGVWRSGVVRAAVVLGAVEIEGRRAQTFRLR